MIAAMRSRHIGLSERDRIKSLQENYHEQVDPFVKLKVDVMDLCLSKMTLFPDGHVETEYTEEGLRIMAEIDRHIEAAQQTMFEFFIPKDPLSAVEALRCQHPA